MEEKSIHPKRILIWGTGQCARIFMELFDWEKFISIKFVDNNEKVQGSSFFNYGKIIGPNEIKKFKYDLIVICITEYNKIVEQCQKLKLNNVYVYKELIFGNGQNEFVCKNWQFLLKHRYRNMLHDDVWRQGIRNVVRKTIDPVIQEMKNTLIVNVNPNTENDTKYVWTCWWQGKEFAPQIVQRCIKCQQIIYSEKKGYSHIVITKDNYKEYIDLPDFICEKVNIGAITLTELSDIIRTKLLMKYGGLWLDSTIYMIAPQNIEQNHSLYSARIINHKFEKRDWAIYNLYSDGKNNLFYWMDKMFMEYWSKESKLIDYFLFSFFLEIIFDENEMIRRELNKIPYNNVQVENLALVMNRKYDKNVWKELCRDTTVFKLSYKREWIDYTLDGELTFYGAFMKGII